MTPAAEVIAWAVLAGFGLWLALNVYRAERDVRAARRTYLGKERTP